MARPNSARAGPLSYEDEEDAFLEVLMADETINIRNISIKCGNCNTYQTLAAFSRRDEWNVYTYECENDVCDPNVTRTIVEVPREIDSFARRDPEWRGGGKHGDLGDGNPVD
jgi:hypothetical protein